MFDIFEAKEEVTRYFNDEDFLFDGEDSTSNDTIIETPYNYTPYPFQEEAWDAKARGYKKFLFLWHRRAGKDKTMWNMFIDFIVDEWDIAGQYFYCLPSGTQAKKVIWQGTDNDGFKFLDHIPPALIKRKVDGDMFVELINGSTIQLVGSDNYDRLVGTNPKGLCFSEYSISNPLGYEYMRPVLARNGGWAMFPYTARGKNHGHKLYKVALANPHTWFLSEKSVEDTTDHDGNRLVTDEKVAEERREGMSEQMIRQEYYNDFDVATLGAYYTEQLSAVRKEGRLTSVPLVDNVQVYTFWDLGRSDSTAIWFVQFIGEEVRIVEYHEDRGKQISQYVDFLDAWCEQYEVKTKPICILPHDAKHKTILSNASAEDQIKTRGYKTDIVTSKVNIMSGIDAVRGLFPRMCFDAAMTEVGFDAVGMYRSTYDPEKGRYTDTPEHDWTSHPADALRYLAVWYTNQFNNKKTQAGYRRPSPTTRQNRY